MRVANAASAAREGRRTPEREFIRGNRDGPGRSNETYTVCRLRVPEERLDREIAAGLHSHSVKSTMCWKCPAHIFLAAEVAPRDRHPDQEDYPAPPVVKAASWKKFGPPETVEVIQRDPDRPKDDPTYTICRIAIPRHRMVSEVEAGLHPRYHVRNGSRGPYVQGNPSKSFDNVNYAESLGPGQMCTRSLLQPAVRRGRGT